MASPPAHYQNDANYHDKANIDKDDSDNNAVIIVKRLQPYDIIMGRGSLQTEYQGNKRLRELVQDYRQAYVGSNKHKDKQQIALAILSTVLVQGGRFLRRVEDEEDQKVIQSQTQSSSSSGSGAPPNHKGKSAITFAQPQSPSSSFLWQVVEDRTLLIQKIKQMMRDVGPETRFKRQLRKRKKVPRSMEEPQQKVESVATLSKYKNNMSASTRRKGSGGVTARRTDNNGAPTPSSSFQTTTSPPQVFLDPVPPKPIAAQNNEKTLTNGSGASRSSSAAKPAADPSGSGVNYIPRQDPAAWSTASRHHAAQAAATATRTAPQQPFSTVSTPSILPFSQDERSRAQQQQQPLLAIMHLLQDEQTCQHAVAAFLRQLRHQQQPLSNLTPSMILQHIRAERNRQMGLLSDGQEQRQLSAISNSYILQRLRADQEQQHTSMFSQFERDSQVPTAHHRLVSTVDTAAPDPQRLQPLGRVPYPPLPGTAILSPHAVENAASVRQYLVAQLVLVDLVRHQGQSATNPSSPSPCFFQQPPRRPGGI